MTAAVGIRVSVVDLAHPEERSEVVVPPGDYVIICAGPCHVASEQHYANGTSQLIVRGRTSTRLVTGAQDTPPAPRRKPGRPPRVPQPVFRSPEPTPTSGASS